MPQSLGYGDKYAAVSACVYNDVDKVAAAALEKLCFRLRIAISLEHATCMHPESPDCVPQSWTNRTQPPLTQPPPVHNNQILGAEHGVQAIPQAGLSIKQSINSILRPVRLHLAALPSRVQDPQPDDSWIAILFANDCTFPGNSCLVVSSS